MKKLTLTLMSATALVLASNSWAVQQVPTLGADVVGAAGQAGGAVEGGGLAGAGGQAEAAGQAGAADRIQYNAKDAAAVSSENANNFTWTFSAKTPRANDTLDASTPVSASNNIRPTPDRPDPEHNPEPLPEPLPEPQPPEPDPYWHQRQL